MNKNSKRNRLWWRMATTVAFCQLLVMVGCPKTATRAPAPASAPSQAAAPPAAPALTAGLPVVGILVYDKVLMTEVTAPFDVFAKKSEAGDAMFNVVTIAESTEPVTTEEGLRIVPDFTLEASPDLDVLVVPSAYAMEAQVGNEKLVSFIREKNKQTKYTMSNCAGAQLVGKSGIADGKRIVTWIGGGAELQKTYPHLQVEDDAKVTFVRDGKFFSSNGNLASYVSALELLEVMTDAKHRKFVESYLYLERLKDWPAPKQ